jgi:glyoxylase-like metal-dependent hydrolase (beta-lactamase superfamily II)
MSPLLHMKKEGQESVYNIYALKFAGPITGSGAFVMWMKDWDKEIERNYYFWCLKNSEEAVVVDAGVSPRLADERQLRGYINPVQMLADIDVNTDKVKHVIITHLHWDHADGVRLFPNAKIYVQKAEYDFWLKDKIASRPPFKFFLNDNVKATFKEIEKSGRLNLIKGDQQILPGVECLLAPGHSVALQAVAINTYKGTAILGSDCGHFFRNFHEDWPSALIIDMVAWMGSFEKLRSRVSSPDLLFPGHDPLMTLEYSEVAPGITRLV